MAPVLGGALGLIFPTLIGLVALSVGFRDGGDMGDFAGSIAATLIFLIAAPTAWVLSFPFIDVTRFTVITFGILTSAPLWWLAGVAIARTSVHWGRWAARYIVVCVGWFVFNIIAIAVIASIVG